MKTLVTSVLCAVLVAGCASTTEGDDEQAVGTSEDALKWKPRTEPWYDCLVGLEICRCSGDIIDCREPIPIFKASLTTAD